MSLRDVLALTIFACVALPRSAFPNPKEIRITALQSRSIEAIGGPLRERIEQLHAAGLISRPMRNGIFRVVPRSETAGVISVLGDERADCVKFTSSVGHQMNWNVRHVEDGTVRVAGEAGMRSRRDGSEPVKQFENLVSGIY